MRLVSVDSLNVSRFKPGPVPVSVGTKMFSVLGSLSPPSDDAELPFPTVARCALRNSGEGLFWL